MADLQGRVLSFVCEPTKRLVEQFFDAEGRFAALTFDMLPDNPPHRFTAADLLAVTLLDVALPPPSVRKVLDSDAEMFSALLTTIPADVDLWNASDEDLTKCRSVAHGTGCAIQSRRNPSKQVDGSQASAVSPGYRQRHPALTGARFRSTF